MPLDRIITIEGAGDDPIRVWAERLEFSDRRVTGHLGLQTTLPSAVFRIRYRADIRGAFLPNLRVDADDLTGVTVTSIQEVGRRKYLDITTGE